MRLTRFARTLFLAALLAPVPALAGFTGTDVLIPAVARIAGAGGAQFTSTVWITNLSQSSTATIEARLYLQGQPNPQPQVKALTLTPGESRVYQNVVTDLFGLTSASGALRFVSTTRLLVSSRTYDFPPGSSLRDTKGLFFGAIPASFALVAGETAHLQGVVTGSDFRYNFGFVELTGAGAKIRATLRSLTGAEVASKEYELGAWEARQVSSSDLSAATQDNARLEATVVSGNGSVLVYGTQIANGSQDSAGFEMSFKEGLLVEAEASSAEGLAASAAYTSATVASGAFDLAPRVGVGTSGLAALAEPPFTGSWDEATGTWTISIRLESGQQASFALQFRAASGASMKFYRPSETSSIWAKGTAAGLQGALDFDLVVGGVMQGVTALSVNGTGTGTYQGASGDVTVSNVVIPKTTGAYPTSGTVTVISGGITITVTFNGTRYAQGTYVYRNKTVTFTIDLETGEVTKP
ncbi:MAG: hypothetical protein IPP07_23020 [Holophagales bacterium]|nr:hypothetical protein [Holophagales bacterium]